MARIRAIRLTPTISTSIYAAGDAVGGLLTFTNISSNPDSGVVLRGVLIHDEDNEAVNLELVLFSETFTPTADNAEFNPSDADLLNCLGAVLIDSWFAFSGNAMGVERDVGMPLKLTGSSGSLFGQLVTRGGTPTYTATDDLSVTILLDRS